MGWQDLSIRNNSLNRELAAVQSEGSYKKSVDSNNDGFSEATQLLDTNKNLISENFDFDSNGAIDYSIRYDENGNSVESYFTNDPKNNEEKTPDFFDKVNTFFNSSKLNRALEKEEEQYQLSHEEISESLSAALAKIDLSELEAMLNKELDIELPDAMPEAEAPEVKNNKLDELRKELEIAKKALEETYTIETSVIKFN